MNRSTTINAATRNRHPHAIGVMDRLGLTHEARTVLGVVLAHLSDGHEDALARLMPLAYSTPSLNTEMRRACEDALAIIGHAMTDDDYRATLVREWTKGGAA